MSPRIARLIRQYRASARRQEQLVRALSAAFQAYWLGLFDRDSLALLDESFYHGRTEALGGQQVSYADDAWNLSGLADWEASLVDDHLGGVRRVVVTGAGGGREVLALLKRGFDAVGFEPNAHLAGAGRRFLETQGHPDRLHRAARDAFPDGAGPCDAVIVGWGSYMLIPGRARRIAFLASARTALEPGAPVVLSFFTRPEKGRLTTATAIAANLLRRIRRAELVERGDALVPNFTHWFTRAEIESELAAAGFELVHFAEAPYGHAVGRAGERAKRAATDTVR